MKTNTKKLVAITLGVVGAFGLGFAGAMLTQQPEVITVTKEVPYIVEKEVPKIVNVTVEKEVPIYKYINKTVYVDNGNLDKVLNFIYDENGDVEYVLDDLDDDQLDMIVDRVVFINDIKAEALNVVKKELFDELDEEEVDGKVLYEGELSRLKLDDDYDEVKLLDIDFDDKDAKVLVSGTFEQRDNKFYFEAEVRFKDNEFYKFKVKRVELI